MGSNLVSLTDRQYMQRLQERILEDYAESMQKRIKVRENEEMERVKNLVLSGKIPIKDAPASMADHPIMLIENYCNKLIAQRRAKIKVPKTYIPQHLYYDDTPDPPSGLSIENGHVFRKPIEDLCKPYKRFLSEGDACSQHDNEEEIQEHVYEKEPEFSKEKEAPSKLENAEKPDAEENGEEEEEDEDEEPDDPYMFSAKKYDKLKYEHPLVKRLRDCETVEEMYALADEIIGVLQTIDAKVADDTVSTITTFSVTPSVAPSVVPSVVSGGGDKASVKEQP